jgi:uncharacterized protein (TIGR02996 family)
MTDDEQALLAAVLAAPADDLPRLVLADWYEEHGQGLRAKFVRTQIDLARLVAADAYDTDEYLAAATAVGGVPNAAYTGWVRRAGLPLAGGVPAVDFKADWVSVRDPATGTAFGFRRGFVERVGTETRHLRALLPAVRRCPVGSLVVAVPGLTRRALAVRLGPAPAGGWAAAVALEDRLDPTADALAAADRDELFDRLLPWLHRFWLGWAARHRDPAHNPEAEWFLRNMPVVFHALDQAAADLNPYPLVPQDPAPGEPPSPSPP